MTLLKSVQKIRFTHIGIFGVFYSSVFFVYGIFGSIVGAKPEFNSIGEWQYAHYAIDYFNYGFVKRGFIGTLFDMAVEGFDIAIANLGYFTFLFCSYIMVLFFLYSFNRFFKTREEWLLFSALIIFSPAIFPHFVFDCGRFDIVLVVLFLISLGLTENGYFFISSILATVGILIHEIYIIIFLPPVFLILMDNCSNFKERRPRLIKALSLPVLATIALYFWGKYEPGISDLTVRLHSEIGSDWDQVISAKVWTRPLSANFSIVWGSLQNFITIFHFIVGFIFLLCNVTWFFYICKINCIGKPGIIYSVFCPLILCLLGIDFARWFSFSVILIFTVLCYLVMNKQVYHFSLGDLKYSYLLLGGSVLLGAYSVTGSFFMVDKVIKILPILL